MPTPPSSAPKPTAMLLLDRPLALDLARLVEILRQTHPAAFPDGPVPATTGAKQNTAVIPIAAQAGVLMMIEHRLPDGWQEIADRARHVPDARAVCERHRAHLVASVMSNAPDKLAPHRVVTAVAGAFAKAYPDSVLAVLWNVTVLNTTGAWAQMSAQAFAPFPQFPTALWVSFHPFNDTRTGGAGVLTQGLAAFVGREVELLGAKDQTTLLVQRAHGLATYLIEKGPIIRDGSTFGMSKTEHIVARLCNSERFPGVPVIAGTLAANP